VRLLSGRRLTKAQLAQKLRDRAFEPSAIQEAVDECERMGYIDDRTYAQLFVKSILDRKAVGRMRLLHDLLRHGVPGDVARAVLDESVEEDESRIERALAKLEALRPEDGYEQLGRRLERLGFTAPEIAKALRRRSQERGAFPTRFKSLK